MFSINKINEIGKLLFLVITVYNNFRVSFNL